MFPCFSIVYGTDTTSGNRVHFRYFVLANAIREHFFDFFHAFVIQLSLIVSRSSRMFSIKTPLFSRVFHILSIGSYPKMVRIKTCRVIAKGAIMANHLFAVQVKTQKNISRKPMSRLDSSSNTDNAITLMVKRSSVQPATSGIVNFPLKQELTHGGISCKDWLKNLCWFKCFSFAPSGIMISTKSICASFFIASIDRALSSLYSFVTNHTFVSILLLPTSSRSFAVPNSPI